MEREQGGEEHHARLKVVGIGGVGLNALNAMVDAGIPGLEFIGVSLSPQRLRACKAETLLMIGSDPRGLSSGGNVDIARQAVSKHQLTLAEKLQGADLVFVVAGMGSGTGTGAAPMIAEIARDSGALVIGIVTTPFGHEGKKRMAIAMAGIGEMERFTDSLIVIPNDRLVTMVPKGTTLLDAFRPADEILRQAMQGLTELITRDGMINVDFNDVRAVMSERGYAMIGIGSASGANRATEACSRAVKTPLMMNTDLQGARGLLVNIAAGSDMVMDEFDAVSRYFHDQVDPDANIIIGLVIDDSMRGTVEVTVVATGLLNRPLCT